MEKIKTLAVLASRMLTAVMVVCGIVVFASCNESMDANEGMSYDVKFSPSSDPAGGIKIINDSLQEDSVRHNGVLYKTTLKRSLKALDRREVVVDNFDDATAGNVFAYTEGEERLVRSEGTEWVIYGRETKITKKVSVAGHEEEVSYTLYQERATCVPASYEFDYINWGVNNASDGFNGALISTMDGFNEMDYKNEISTNYLGYVQNANEVIAWFSKDAVPDKPTVTGHEATGDRKDYTTYTNVTYEKFDLYSDGTRESVEKDSENLPIRIVPETNWTITVDNLGTYVSNAFAKTLISKTPRKQGNFSFNEYCYRVYNTVAGQTNSFLIYVPNDIVREDKEAKKEYANTDLVVNKGNEATTFSTETSTNKVYKYNVVANVVFGASQSVTLPGTVNVKKATEPETNHEHGKIKEVLFTSTPNENRSSYKNVCVIVFEDGYRSIGMAANAAPTFNFNMSSKVAGINSTVYADGSWIPAKAVDGSSYMTWYDESGKARRNLDYLTANRDRWNNGHNTVKDVERSAKISSDGYSVTLYRQNSAGQTLHF